MGCKGSLVRIQSPRPSSNHLIFRAFRRFNQIVSIVPCDCLARAAGEWSARPGDRAPWPLPFPKRGNFNVRIRTIKPDFFKDEKLAEVEPSVRLMFVGLWLIADKNGRLEYRPKFIRAELFPYDPDVPVEAYLAELVSRGFLDPYEIDGRKYLEIHNFKKHQIINHREAASGIPAPELPGEAGARPGVPSNAQACLVMPGGKGRERKGKEGKGKEGMGNGEGKPVDMFEGGVGEILKDFPSPTSHAEKVRAQARAIKANLQARGQG